MSSVAHCEECRFLRKKKFRNGIVYAKRNYYWWCKKRGIKIRKKIVWKECGSFKPIERNLVNVQFWLPSELSCENQNIVLRFMGAIDRIMFNRTLYAYTSLTTPEKAEAMRTIFFQCFRDDFSFMVTPIVTEQIDWQGEFE